jgi:type IV secretion system protein TrbJ
MLVPQPLGAQTVFCTNCGTEWTQLANNLQLIEQLRRQVALVEEAIKQYQNMLLNSKGLASQFWGNALGDIKRLTSLLAQAKSLSYAAGNLDGQFAKKYSDFQTYASREMDTGGFAAKYQQWSEDTNSSVLTTLKAAGLQAEQIEGSEDTYIRQLEMLATSAEGRMQALQIGNQITLALARQLQKLRQLVLMELQLQSNFIQSQTDRDMVERAAWYNFAKAKPATKSGKSY